MSVGRSDGRSLSHTRVEILKKADSSKIMVSEGMKRKSKTIGTTFKPYKYTSKNKSAINSTNWSTSVSRTHLIAELVCLFLRYVKKN